ncbi:M24 family metallopeptidase [Amycolatopsis sp. H20-H5]|uniref:M24 family metallopeptidase n=1 Tax=Amycolatopsis sp. H20-H5 TaxID=3046309 RepID=UPI002DB7651B|nr:M24 family metallopeptidase [Amycolatopsis sp. H20-H5]MEC3974456.1 M24 family metallopeptidase [Amycolatopsis sp. H20-H5]
MFDRAEAVARWARVRQLMEDQDIDVLVAIDWSRDEILRGNQRWLTGYIPIGGPAAALLDRDGTVELISDRIGKPVSDYYTAHEFPIELVNGFSPSLLVERIARRNPSRLGVAETESFPWTIAAALDSRSPAPQLVDVSGSLERLRLRKSAQEIALVRRGCEIADAVWEHVPEIFKIGRRNREIVADIDHLVRLEGAEGGFHLVLPVPFRGRPMQSLANPERIEANARYLVEISPRYDGYYSQVTIPVTTRPDDKDMWRAYEDLVEVKQAVQPDMRPGADLSEIARSVEKLLAKRGHTMKSLSLGHFCGMALEEPRHDPTVPFELEEGMTLIFHPILADEEFVALMRADTYLITERGAERLTRYEGAKVTLS